MIRRKLFICGWECDFFFSVAGGYDIDRILDLLYDDGAPMRVLRNAEQKMRADLPNEGFTWSDYWDRRSVVVIGPTSSGAEFLDSFVHEIGHLSDHIAQELGIRLDSERSKYILGDMAREFADVVCRLGCRHCN